MKAQALADHLAENPVDDDYQPLSTYFLYEEVNAVKGEWEIRDVKLIPYRQHVEHLSKWFKSVEFRYVPRFHNELADALATLASILPYPGNVYIDPLEIQIRERHGYCNTVKVESNVQPWLVGGFFLRGEVLYKRTPDLNLLRCVDAQEAGRIMNEVHTGVCGPHMNGYVPAKKILRAGYY
uniref:RNase H type-1 domain-containing protein n=1 Tax=Nicotiana tabacum TaxID=4097 RepID=A0A1S4D5D9_TOBAC|nr:PREDICTED: uncharacterized protein LOC107826155 [Nicotiana tabacum]